LPTANDVDSAHIVVARPGGWQDDVVSHATTERYHHGNLRNALVDAAVARAREGGPQRVVLRELLRDVGVSHNAAYRHFADRGELLRAVRDSALEQLAAAMRDALDELPESGDPVATAMARLRAVGARYVEFALTEPGLFRTAFFTGADEPHAAATRDKFGQAAAIADAPPYRILRACVDDLISVGAAPAERRDEIEIGAWSAVHGISTLLLDSPLGVVDAATRERLTEHVLDLVAREF
jgi:AcrR family transcriptional regulator